MKDLCYGLGWATNESLSILRGEGHVLIDCTFKIVPFGFKQCLIIMCFDKCSNLFIPCIYVLLTSKTEYIYCSIFHEVIVILNYNFMPKYITVDFELALIGAIKYQFTKSRIMGCFFHFKQAIVKKMKEFKINNKEIKIAARLINFLTIIPIEEIKFGIEFIKKNKKLKNILCKKFWLYFKKTWIIRISPKIWNINSIQKKKLIGRTNNAIESYNKRIGELFGYGHPKILFFIDVLKNEFEYFENLIQGAKSTDPHKIKAKEKKIVVKIPKKYLLYLKKKQK